jgi:hypothetical protein
LINYYTVGKLLAVKGVTTNPVAITAARTSGGRVALS